LEAAIRAYLSRFKVFSNRWNLAEREIPVGDWKLKLGSARGRIPVGGAPPTLPNVQPLIDSIEPAGSVAESVLRFLFNMSTTEEEGGDGDPGVIDRIIGFINRLCGPGDEPPGPAPGTQDPWNIDFPKRALANYPDLFVGPRRRRRRVTQKSLCEAFGESPKPGRDTDPADLPPLHRAVFNQLSAADQDEWRGDGYPILQITPT